MTLHYDLLKKYCTLTSYEPKSCTSQLWDKIWANLARPNFTSNAVSANCNQSYLHIHDPGLSA